MPEFLTEEELIERWRRCISAGTLANWRAAGTGPSFTKIGKAVLYPLDALVEWEKRRMRGPAKVEKDSDAR